MGPTRKRDLTAAVVGAAVVGYLLVQGLYRWFPPITVWTGLSLLAVAVIEALWARYVRTKINDGEIGSGPGWLHPLAVARSLMVAKASAWVGALMLGWWIGVLVYFLPRRSWLRAAAEDTSGRWWRPSARWLCSSPRCGCNIAANPRRTPASTARARKPSRPGRGAGNSQRIAGVGRHAD